MIQKTALMVIALFTLFSCVNEVKYKEEARNKKSILLLVTGARLSIGAVVLEFD